MARKLPYKWWNSWDAFPKRILALDLLASPDPDEEGSRYCFEFIDEGRIGVEDQRLWFKASNILGMEAGPAMLNWLMQHGLDQEQLSRAYETLDRLHRSVRVDQVVAFYEEKSQDIERVLSIFIRCNSGGTPLSYSNLLLSIAVSQWKILDARREVHGLVDEMNKVRPGLLFNADFVLKAGLMLSDIASVGFRVENFTYDNMAVLEENWPNIRQALMETAELVDRFGFDSRTIQATNSLLPIAYYLYKKGAPRDFESSDQFVHDRAVIRGWLTRSILKESGIWGSGLDTLLTALREVIRNSDSSEFPAAELRRILAQRGKTLDFVQEEIEDLADMRLGDRRIFPLLTMLFPYMDSRDGSDIDHVFPKSRFTPTPAQGGRCRRTSSLTSFATVRIGSPTSNCWTGQSTTKNGPRCLPTGWTSIAPASEARKVYCDRHRLGEVPKKVTGFMDFYSERRARLLDRIAVLVNTV